MIQSQITLESWQNWSDCKLLKGFTNRDALLGNFFSISSWSNFFMFWTSVILTHLTWFILTSVMKWLEMNRHGIKFTEYWLLLIVNTIGHYFDEILLYFKETINCYQQINFKISFQWKGREVVWHMDSWYRSNSMLILNTFLASIGKPNA